MTRKPPRKPGIALLGVAGTYVDAMTWEARLRADNIPCLVRDAGATIAELQGPFGPSTYEVYVPGSALSRAKDLLREELKTPFPSAGEASVDKPGFAWVWAIGLVISFITAAAIILGLR
jgi:hypothetical protein